MVAAKLYERGVSAGQVMAFLIASPWNSFSLTIILIALIGFKWTLTFIALSKLPALITGFIFDKLVTSQRLPANPNQSDVPENFRFWPEAKTRLKALKIDCTFMKSIILIALIGFKWTLTFIALSKLPALITGFIFDKLVTSQRLPANPNQSDVPENFRFWPEAKTRLKALKIDCTFMKSIATHSLNDSKMVLRWIFLGVLLAALPRTFVSPDAFQARLLFDFVTTVP